MPPASECLFISKGLFNCEIVTVFFLYTNSLASTLTCFIILKKKKGSYVLEHSKPRNRTATGLRTRLNIHESAGKLTHINPNITSSKISR